MSACPSSPSQATAPHEASASRGTKGRRSLYAPAFFGHPDSIPVPRPHLPSVPSLLPSRPGPSASSIGDDVA